MAMATPTPEINVGPYSKFVYEHLDGILPAGKRIPLEYFLRVGQLRISRQPLTLLKGVELPIPGDGPYFRVRRWPRVVPGDVTSPVRPPPGAAYFNPESATCRPKLDYTDGFCAACHRRARLGRYWRGHALCSKWCVLAAAMFVNDLRALSYLPPILPGDVSRDMTHAAMLRFVPPPLLDIRMRRTRLAHYERTAHHTIFGTFANWTGFAMRSTFLIEPVALRRSLRRIMQNTDPDREGGETSSGMSPTLSPAPSPPTPAGEESLVAIHSLSNPVVRRTAQIVLNHLETANDFLSAKRPKKTKFGEGRGEEINEGVIWNKDQVALFLGLLNRTIPAISASINLNEGHQGKDPADMSREELDAAARRARIISTPYTKTE